MPNRQNTPADPRQNNRPAPPKPDNGPNMSTRPVIVKGKSGPKPPPPPPPPAGSPQPLPPKPAIISVDIPAKPATKKPKQQIGYDSPGTQQFMRSDPTPIESKFNQRVTQGVLKPGPAPSANTPTQPTPKRQQIGYDSPGTQQAMRSEQLMQSDRTSIESHLNKHITQGVLRPRPSGQPAPNRSVSDINLSQNNNPSSDRGIEF